MKNTAWFWSTRYYKKNPKVYDLKFIVKCIYFSFFFLFFSFFFFSPQAQSSLDVFSMSHESEEWKMLGRVSWGTLCPAEEMSVGSTAQLQPLEEQVVWRGSDHVWVTSLSLAPDTVFGTQAHSVSVGWIHGHRNGQKASAFALMGIASIGMGF